MRENLVAHAAERKLAQGTQTTTAHHEQIGFRLRRIANDFVGRAAVQQHDLVVDAGICQNLHRILDNLALGLAVRLDRVIDHVRIHIDGDNRDDLDLHIALKRCDVGCLLRCTQ